MPTMLSKEDPVHQTRPAERFFQPYRVAVMIGMQRTFAFVAVCALSVQEVRAAAMGEEARRMKAERELAPEMLGEKQMLSASALLRPGRSSRAVFSGCSGWTKEGGIERSEEETRDDEAFEIALRSAWSLARCLYGRGFGGGGFV